MKKQISIRRSADKLHKKIFSPKDGLLISSISVRWLLVSLMCVAPFASCVKESSSPDLMNTAMTKNSSNSEDAASPTIKITFPGNGDTVAGTITIKVKVTDNVAVDTVQCEMDGVLIGSTTKSPYKFVWNTTAVMNGSHILLVRAVDSLKNVNTKKITIHTLNTGVLPMEQQLFDLINQERVSVGVPALNFDSRVFSAARAHSTDMADNNFFGHTGSDGSGLSTRLTKAGYNSYAAAENISAGQATATDVFNGWMANPNSRSVLLDPTFKDGAVGTAYSGARTSSYHYYWTFDEALSQ